MGKITQIHGEVTLKNDNQRTGKGNQVGELMKEMERGAQVGRAGLVMGNGKQGRVQNHSHIGSIYSLNGESNVECEKLSTIQCSQSFGMCTTFC